MGLIQQIPASTDELHELNKTLADVKTLEKARASALECYRAVIVMRDDLEHVPMIRAKGFLVSEVLRNLDELKDHALAKINELQDMIYVKDYAQTKFPF